MNKLASHEPGQKPPELEPLPPPAAFWVKAAGSAGFAGHLPKFPGTWGTAVAGGILALFLLGGLANPWTLLALAAGFSLASLLFGSLAERAYGRVDPGEFVLDEFAGYYVALLFLDEYTFVAGFLAFALFRLFDIVKLWPARSLEKVGGGAGMLLDDLAAGVFANLTLRLVLLIL